MLGILSRAGQNPMQSSVGGITSGMGAMGMRNTPMPSMPAPYGGPVSAPSPPPAAPSYGGAPPASYGNTAPPMFPGGPPSGGGPYVNSGSPVPVNNALKRPVPPPPPAPAGVQAKALWDYNLNGQVSTT